MKLEDILHTTNRFWQPLTDDEIEFLFFLRNAEDDVEDIKLAQELMSQLRESVESVKAKSRGIAPDELIYITIANAYSKDDYLKLIAQYGTPTNRDLDFDAVREYEALGEAVYRIGALLAYGEGFGEYADVEDILEVTKRPPQHDSEFTIPASLDLAIRIPDYRRAMMPHEVRIEDINTVYWPPMINAVRHHEWITEDNRWRANAVYDVPDENGMRLIKMTVSACDDNQDAWLNDDEMRFFSNSLAHEATNEQVRDLRISFYDGEIEVLDAVGGIDPPIWQMVWVALAQAKGKLLPSICRTCGKLIDRRSERRNKTVSCSDAQRKCTAAFNNNGKKRMIKRNECGRPFKPDSLFGYIEEYRADVHHELKEQKRDPDWPPKRMGKH